MKQVLTSPPGHPYNLRAEIETVGDNYHTLFFLNNKQINPQPEVTPVVGLAAYQIAIFFCRFDKHDLANFIIMRTQDRSGTPEELEGWQSIINNFINQSPSQ